MPPNPYIDSIPKIEESNMDPPELPQASPETVGQLKPQPQVCRGARQQGLLPGSQQWKLYANI